VLILIEPAKGSERDFLLTSKAGSMREDLKLVWSQ